MAGIERGDKPLDGQVAIVTGASSGIGAAIAKFLARGGAKVAMAARRLEQMEKLKESLDQEGCVTIATKCDVTNRTEVGEMVRHTECTLGPVDILVNNAGLMYFTSMKNIHHDEWDRQINVNCKGVLNCVGAALPGMVKAGRGHIVNITSDAARRGFAGLAVYSGTKFFIEGLSQGMRLELAPLGIKVTCVQPGNVKTELASMSTDPEASEMYDTSALHKVLEPDDVARAVMFAVTQPPYSAVNEILIEPREEPI